MVTVNLPGTAAVVRAALPALLASRGRIVTVASTLGLRALPDATAYCASKFGVVGFTRALAAELAGSGGRHVARAGRHAHRLLRRSCGAVSARRPSPAQRPGGRGPRGAWAFALPPGCELRELVIAPAVDGSWPP